MLATTACFCDRQTLDGHSQDERLLLKAESNIPTPSRQREKPCREFYNGGNGSSRPEERVRIIVLITDLEPLSLFYTDRAKNCRKP